MTTGQTVRTWQAKEMREDRAEEDRVIKRLLFQRAFLFVFVFRDVILVVWLRRDGTQGLWPIANELFSAGSTASRHSHAGCSICMFKLYKDTSICTRDDSFLVIWKASQSLNYETDSRTLLVCV